MQEPDLSATLSADGHLLLIYGVNSTAQRLELRAELVGWASPPLRATVHVLRDAEQAGTPEVLNSRDEPGRVRLFSQHATRNGCAGNLAFDPFSLTLYELELGSWRAPAKKGE